MDNLQHESQGSRKASSGTIRRESLLIFTIALISGGCAVRRPFAKAQLIVPRDCIERIEVLPDTECRQNLDGTGELVCKPLRLIRKKGCEHVEATPPPPQAQVPQPKGGLPEPR